MARIRVCGQLPDRFGERERILVCVDMRGEPRVSMPGERHGDPLRHAGSLQIGDEGHAEGVEVDFPAPIVEAGDSRCFQVGAKCVMIRNAAGEHATRTWAAVTPFGEHCPSGRRDGQHIGPLRLRRFRPQADHRRFEINIGPLQRTQLAQAEPGVQGEQVDPAAIRMDREQACRLSIGEGSAVEGLLATAIDAPDMLEGGWC